MICNVALDDLRTGFLDTKHGRSRPAIFREWCSYGRSVSPEEGRKSEGEEISLKRVYGLTAWVSARLCSSVYSLTAVGVYRAAPVSTQGGEGGECGNPMV